ncbi:PREDICTED: putative [Prunus dulcis]|uniref:PREDICTED: putative n=1 Tax=Prunus dulcis TaxID=3755 RepID=A0A5E4G8D5_PRUDU|nr:PREDICTED: putative [Prunus dulcis]
METKAAKKIRLVEEENERNGRGRDRFSDLPNEISNRTFSFLPMKAIAEVSFTSKRWRSLWDSFPILDFSEVCPFTSQKLTIESCRSMNQLGIFCENLKDLQVCGMEKICLDISGMGLERLAAVKLHLTSVISNSCVNIFAPNLQTFQWGPDEVDEKGLVHFWLPVNDAKVKTHTVVILSGLSQAEKLTISFQILEFKSSPIVEGLKIVISPIHRPQDDKWNDILLDNALWSEEQFWESQAQTLNSFLCHIKKVDFSVVTGIDETVISVARFLLKHGIGLQEMNICSQNWKAYQQNQPGWQAKFKIIEELPRASEDVEIVWLF